MVIKGSEHQMMMMIHLVGMVGHTLSAQSLVHHSCCFSAHLLTAGVFLNAGDSPHPNGERKAKGPYFEFAKKKWETEDTVRYLLTDSRLCMLMLFVCSLSLAVSLLHHDGVI